MIVAVLGTGMIGTLIVRELCESPLFARVLAVDSRPEAVERCVATSGGKAAGIVADLGRPEEMDRVLRGAGAAVAALPHALSPLANAAAVQAGCHLIDLVGSRYLEKRALDRPACRAGVLVLTGCGVAPGLVSVLAAQGIAELDEADEALMYCGGLPRHPLPPLWYQVVFRLESVMGLYTRPARVLQDGQVVEVPALSGLEEVEFPAPVGVCEAAYSDAPSAVYTLQGKVKRLAEKTVRYKGHFGKMGVLAELGFLSDDPVAVDGTPVVPRRLSMALLEPQLKGSSGEDVTVARVVVTGRKDGRPARRQWDMVDGYDAARGYTSMAKTTGFMAITALEWLAAGRIDERGFLAPEELFTGARFEPFLAALRSRGVDVTRTA